MSVEKLLAAGRGPLGPAVHVDLGVEHGPLAELSAMLGHCNGFYLYNAAVQVFRAGRQGVGPELETWNHDETWKEVYGQRVHGLFCFAQDIVGVQFAVVDNAAVVAFDPESAEVTVLGPSLYDWAQWLLADPDMRSGGPLAKAWQDETVRWSTING